MGWWWVGLALILPWMAMTLWLRLLWPEPTPGRWPMVLGYGYLLGMTGSAGLLWLQGVVGWPLGSRILLLVSGLLLVAALLLLGQRKNLGIVMVRVNGQLNFWRGLAFGLILLWVIARFVGLALEVWWQPLFPWDAWTTWGARAKVWSELQTLAPFVSPEAWMEDRTGTLYTIEAWDYPATISLIAAWPTLALGIWNETAANIPWLGVALALGLGFYGQARIWGASSLTAMVFVWMLLSIPLLNTQVALAGYADLWLATALGLAMMAFLQWLRSGDPRQAFLTILSILVCVSMKREGLVWALLFIPSLIAAKLSKFVLFILAGLLMALGIILWVKGGIAFELPGLGAIRLLPNVLQLPFIDEFKLGYHAIWEPVFRHYFSYSNWHLFIYLLVFSLGVAVVAIFLNSQRGWQKGGLVWALSSLAAIYFLFFWTDAYLWAMKGTSINRILLHFVPALLFWIMAVWLEFVRTLESRARLA